MKVILTKADCWTAFNLPVGIEMEIEGQEPHVASFIPDALWLPKEGEKYWFIHVPDGQVKDSQWDCPEGDEIDRERRAFLGVYKTQENALEVLSLIRKFLKKK